MKKTAAQICHEILHIDSCLNDLINTWDAFICQRGTLASLSASIQHGYVYSKKQNKTHTHTHTSRSVFGKAEKGEWATGSCSSSFSRLPSKFGAARCWSLVLWLFPPRRSASLRVGSLVLHLLEPPRQQETLLVSCTPLIRISR